MSQCCRASRSTCEKLASAWVTDGAMKQPSGFASKSRSRSEQGLQTMLACNVAAIDPGTIAPEQIAMPIAGQHGTMAPWRHKRDQD